MLKKEKGIESQNYFSTQIEQFELFRAASNKVRNK
jgi:hypothetical protein